MLTRLALRTSKRRQTRHRGIVLGAVLGFLMLQVGFYYPLSHWWPQLQDVEFGSKLANLRRQEAQCSPGQPLILALGSSMTAMAFRPEVLETLQPGLPDAPAVFNLAMNSCGVVVDVLCLRRLLADGIRPDWLLVEASPHFLTFESNRVQQGAFLPLHRVQFQDLATLERYEPQPGNLRRQWWNLQLCPWYTHRELLQNWLLPGLVPSAQRVDRLWRHTDRWGWEVLPDYVAAYEHFHRNPELMRQTILNAFAGKPPPPISEAMGKALRELLTTARQQGISVVLVRLPESSALRQVCPTDHLAKIEALYQRLCRETGAIYVNAVDWLEDAHFVEGAHVRPEGASVYTQRLEREVLLPLLARPPQTTIPPRRPRRSSSQQLIRNMKSALAGCSGVPLE